MLLWAVSLSWLLIYLTLLHQLLQNSQISLFSWGRASLQALVIHCLYYMPVPVFSFSVGGRSLSLTPQRSQKECPEHHAVSMCYRDLDVGLSMSRARTWYKNVRICVIVNSIDVGNKNCQHQYQSGDKLYWSQIFFLRSFHVRTKLFPSSPSTPSLKRSGKWDSFRSGKF